MHKNFGFPGFAGVQASVQGMLVMDVRGASGGWVSFLDTVMVGTLGCYAKASTGLWGFRYG